MGDFELEIGKEREFSCLINMHYLCNYETLSSVSAH